MDPTDVLLRQTLGRVRSQRARPGSTYRLQFHKGFTFDDAAALAPYFADLGITHCYASPYLKARPGSQHGYDISNHQLLNPEVGSEEDYEYFVNALAKVGLSHILDMVPNHMGIVGNENPWWNDVLENGPSSPHAGYFDIDWHHSPRVELHGRVLLPVLGKPYARALEDQEIQLAHEGGAFVLCYFDHRFPVAPGTYDRVLAHRLDELERRLGRESPALMEYESVVTAVRHLPGREETDPARVAERQREKEVIKRRLAALEESSPEVRRFLTENVTLFNGVKEERHSFDLLDDLLNAQAYRLAYWRVAADEINYRRFFDVNELAALSMERPEVFEATHALVLRLLAEGKIAGLRIDHPDGLYDPQAYLEQLQRSYLLACARATGLFDDAEARSRFSQALEVAAANPDAALVRRPLYLVVEKILGRDESLPAEWPVDGTSGYEFLNTLNGLFVDGGRARDMTRVYDAWLGEHLAFSEVVYQKKFLILQVSLSSELHMLAHQLDRLAQRNRASRDFTLNSLRHALREVIASFPVYRSYISARGVRPEDRRHVLLAVRRARRRSPAISASIFDFVRDMLLLVYPDSATEVDKEEQQRFVGKFQQVTAPVMAKGLEDTAFYVYNRLVSLNEVGGDPDRFGVPPAALHAYFQDRRQKWPLALSATSTHDTKRSEDVRARLDVLSELPHDWQECLPRWSKMNAGHRVELEDLVVPGPNEEYFLYQTLLGAWPLEPYREDEYAQFAGRIQAYMEKAIHEAKVHTSWVNPDPAYDEAMHLFVGRVLDETANAAFLDDFRAFQNRLTHYGLLNSLAQTLVKLTAPGVPDLYQGTELWDFSLVDPDNRRPVDYGLRQRLMAELTAEVMAAGDNRRELCRRLLKTKKDGRVKLYLTMQTLHCRRAHPELFAAGEYIPAEVTGAAADHVFAFARRNEGQWVLVAVPRLVTRLVKEDQAPLGEVWGDTAVHLPGAPGGLGWRNVLTGQTLSPAERDGQLSFAIGELFADLPVTLLVAEP